MNVADKTYDPTPARRIACIGLGTMGAPMAAHLQRAGHTVTVYNRTAAKTTAWVQAHGGQSAPTPREAAQGADIVVTCVGNDDDLREVCTGPQGAFHSLASGAVIVDHTTTSAEVARELAQAARERGLRFIDTPVSGGNLGALNGVLTVMCGGEAEAYARIQPVIAAYARAITHLGDSGAGQLAKMVNQIAVAGLLQGLAEALAFGEKAGLDMPRVLEVISQGAASSWQMVNRPHHDCRPVRLRLCRRLDARGPRSGAGRRPSPGRPPARHRAGRPVLCRRAGHGRWPAGHLQPDQTPALSPLKAGCCCRWPPGWPDAAACGPTRPR